MRTALVAPLVLAGCLSEPTGVDPVWPPPDLAVRAVAAGDLDGDGVDDLAVVGDDAIYLLDGATELLPSPTAATRYTAKVAATVVAPARAVIFGSRVVVLDRGDNGVRVQIFGSDLAPGWSKVMTEPPDEGANVLSAHASVIGPTGSVLFTFAGGVRFLESSQLVMATAPAEPARLIVPPALGFMSPLAADAAPEVGSNPAMLTALVSEPGRTWRGRSAAGGAPSYTWTQVRSSGTWPVQLAASLIDDNFPDVIGLEGGTAPCAIDGSLPDETGQPTCLGALPPVGAPPVGMLFADFGGPPARDLAVVRGNALHFAPALAVVGGALTAEPMAGGSFEVEPVALASWRPMGTASPSVVVIAEDGAIDCRRLDATADNVVACPR